MFYLLYRRYDANTDSMIDFTEFCSMILPKNQEIAAILAGRPDFYMHRQELELQNYFNLDTKYEMSKLFETILNNEFEYERLRAQLQGMIYFNVKEAFSHMDYDFKGYLSQEDFYKFLTTNGVFNPS